MRHKLKGGKILKFVPLAIIICGFFVFYFLGWHKYVSWSGLKEHHAILEHYVRTHMVFSSLLFIFTYTIYTSLGLPGGFILIILEGDFFPQPFSTLYAALASTLGGLILFLSVRYALGDYVQSRGGHFFHKMQGNFRRNAAAYLLLLRNLPLPFGLVSTGAALFGMRVSSFAWATFFGILPLSFFLTQIGGGLNAILETEGEVTWRIIVSNPHFEIALAGFMMMAIFIFVFRKYIII